MPNNYLDFEILWISKVEFRAIRAVKNPPTQSLNPQMEKLYQRGKVTQIVRENARAATKISYF